MSIPFLNFFRQLSYAKSIFIASKLFSLLPTIQTLEYKVIIFNLYTLNFISYSTNKNYPKKYVTVIYARYSSDNQTEQSIEGQIRVCGEYAQRNNILILATYIDRAMTGTNDNRPDFKRMMKDSEKREWDYILVLIQVRLLCIVLRLLPQHKPSRFALRRRSQAHAMKKTTRTTRKN